MKAVILAGGFGTRICEETDLIPKPMVKIGGMPILWHILKIYSSYNVNDFIICCGYKGYIIKEYFSNYFLHMSDVTFDMINNRMHVHQNNVEPWSVTLVDTGQDSMTGGRLKRIKEFVEDEEFFFFTYGDAVSNINIDNLAKFHLQNNKIATVTATRPPGRFGNLDMEKGLVKSFEEKPKGDNSYINAGFFVLAPKVFDYIDGDQTVWEKKPLEILANQGQLSAYIHNGFWQCMDTLRDKRHLESLWQSNNVPWKTW